MRGILGLAIGLPLLAVGLGITARAVQDINQPRRVVYVKRAKPKVIYIKKAKPTSKRIVIVRQNYSPFGDVRGFM